MATKVLVTEVPMLAPMIIGTAMLILTIPEPMPATMIEENVDELWTRTVPKIPIIKPITGFCRISCWKILPKIKIKSKSVLELQIKIYPFLLLPKV